MGLAEGSSPRTSGPSVLIDFAFKNGLWQAKRIIAAVCPELSFFAEFCPGRTMQYSAGIYIGFSLVPVLRTGISGLLMVKL
jgi:hypothetical protein